MQNGNDVNSQTSDAATTEEELILFKIKQNKRIKLNYILNSLQKAAEIAEQHKNEGNTLYKNAKYRESIEFYTKAIG